MSAEDRALLSAAANTVAGISCTPYFRQTTRPGDAYVRLDRMNRDSSGFAYMNVWQVIVILPQDLAAAEKYLDDKIEDLLVAIREVMVITTVVPQRLSLDSGILPVVFIEGNRAT